MAIEKRGKVGSLRRSREVRSLDKVVSTDDKACEFRRGVVSASTTVDVVKGETLVAAVGKEFVAEHAVEGSGKSDGEKIGTEEEEEEP